MKKLLSVFILAFAFLFVSCAAENQSALWYQNGLVSVSATMETGAGERFGIEISFSDDEKSITVKEPESISGVVFSLRSNMCFFSVGEVETKVPDEAAEGLCSVIEAFELTEGAVSEIGKDRNGNTFLNASTDLAQYTVSLDESGMPSEIVIKGPKNIKLSDIKLVVKDAADTARDEANRT